MAKIFGISTAVVLLLSAFVAFKNKTAYESEVAKTTEATQKLTASKEKLKEAEEILPTLPGELASVEAENAELTKEEETQKAANEELKNQKATAQATLDANKAKLTAITEQSAQIGGVKELASQLKITSEEIETLTQEISDAEAKLANLTAQSSQAQSAAAAVKLELDRVANNESSINLNTRIRSYYPTWGFVTLAGGNNAGVVAKSTLDVVRDGQTIAKLLVTTVETSTASASIIPDTLAADATLQVGDRVVAGTKVEKTAPAKN